uniref:Zinc finger protein 512 n=1 Tax=Cynoglossus semilaevis TaxID=244447 RepID=A0A3P8UUS4_CYNSE
MESANITEEMSPLSVPRKRKSAQMHFKGGSLCPVVQRIPDRSFGSTEVRPKNVLSDDQEAVKMKRMCRRKRYQDLSCVSVGPDPTTSCSVMSSADLANGGHPGSTAPPTVTLPSSEDSWSHQPDGSKERSQPHDQSWKEPNPNDWGPGGDRDQTWLSGRNRTLSGQEQTRMTGRGRGPEQSWGAARDRGHDQASQEPGRNQGREDQGSSVQEQAWESGGNQEPVWSQDMWRPDTADVGKASPAPPTGEQTPAFTNLFPKKEPPTYPPGSQEERWQLQIVAKGRVACPKCRSVSRKTVEGLKKHMGNCRLELFTCQHCGKQLKSSTGMKYHVMADHSHLPAVDNTKDLDDRDVKDKLRTILKRLGKLKCSKEGCHAAFTSIMGYIYHTRKCGKEKSELEKMLLNCSHCGKPYRSRAGLEYHLKSEHAPTAQATDEDEALKAPSEANTERTASGRVQRASAQVANFHLAEIANNDLPKDWPKRKFPSDLVPDDQKLKYSRPGLPAFSQEVLRKWKNEVKLQRKVQCPNQGCGSTYTSVSGLKAHLGLCTRGEFEVGKYRCLICTKEFNSESGVKYHINSVHSQDWFLPNKKASKKFEQFLKNQSREIVLSVDKQIVDRYNHHHLQHHLQHHLHQQPLQPLHHLHHHLHPQQQNLPEPSEAPTLHYTSLEPAGATLWADAPSSEQAPIEMELDEGEKPEENSDGGCGVVEDKQVELEEVRVNRSSNSNTGTSSGTWSCESEAEQRDEQRLTDQ